MDNFTTTITNTTTSPYRMPDDTKLIICIVSGLFILPVILFLLIGAWDIIMDYIGVRRFENGLIMSLHRIRNGEKRYKKRKTSIIIEHIDVEEDCPICMEKLDGKIGHLACNHYFHEKCLKNWINTSPYSNCPMCRKN